MDPQTITAPVTCSFAGHDGPFGAFSVKRLVATGMVEKLGNMRGVRPPAPLLGFPNKSFSAQHAYRRGLHRQQHPRGRSRTHHRRHGALRFVVFPLLSALVPVLTLAPFLLTSELDGANRMGASFGAMFASGIKAGKEAIRLFESYKVVDGEVVA